MIPETAVEAALLAFAEAPYEPPTSTEQVNLNNRAQITVALEAAAPYMLAEAKAAALVEAAEVAERGEGGGHDSGECDDWAAWLRSHAATHRPTP